MEDGDDDDEEEEEEEEHVYVSPISSSTLRGVSASWRERNHSSSEVLSELHTEYSRFQQ